VRLAIVTAQAGDTVESLASRMALTERAAERFRVLNGLDRGGPLLPGDRYKLVVD
jgi:predicted Zn-dependent protease